MKHIQTIQGPSLRPTEKTCGTCKTSCQSACKTSCTIANQPCAKNK